jgi:hypothetical protein
MIYVKIFMKILKFQKFCEAPNIWDSAFQMYGFGQGSLFSQAQDSAFLNLINVPHCLSDNFFEHKFKVTDSPALSWPLSA